jgi:foldase protein PrsA
MSKHKRVPARQAPETEIELSVHHDGISGRAILIFALVAIAALIALIIWYQNSIAPFQRPIASIDNNNVIRMGYFLKRLNMSSNDIDSVLRQLVSEDIVQIASNANGVKISDEDMDAGLQLVYQQSLASNATNPSTNFETWYEDVKKQTGLTDTEYKNMVKANLLRMQIQTNIIQNLPETLEQVHLNVIITSSQANAQAIKTKIDGGMSFTDAVEAYSLDSTTASNGGDAGWIPKGVLSFESAIFGLDIGQISDAIAIDSSSTSSQWGIFMVSEKDPKRAIDSNQKQAIAVAQFTAWLAQETQNHNIATVYNFNDEQNQAWIQYQLARMSKSK